MITLISSRYTAAYVVAAALLSLSSLSPSFAAKPVCPGPHPSCNDDGGSGGESTFSVEFGGEMVGQSGADNWRSGILGKNSIGLNDSPHPNGPDVGTVLELHLLDDIDDGATCFQSNEFPFGSFSLHQAYIKEGKGGRADSWIWIHGVTITGQQEILYVLKLFGQFDPETAWPPSSGSHLIMFTDWELVVEGGGRSAKNGSCSGEGETTVAMTVTAIP